MAGTSVNLPFPPHDGDPVPLLFWVPANKVLAIQEQVANLLSTQPGGQDGDGAYKPRFPRNHGPQNAWRLPAWKGDEHDEGRWVLNTVNDSQRRVLAHLVSAGVSGVWTSELRNTAGYGASQSMSGVFKAMAGRFRSVNRQPLWNGGPKDPESGQKLRILNNDAQRLFADLIKNDYPDLAAEFGIT